MKRVKFIYKILPLLLVSIFLSACDNGIQDIPKVQEKLELTASASDIAINFDNPREKLITFDWTEARETSGDNLLFYTTKLDVVGNNFGTATAIINSEDDGVFSRSFTSEQIYSWMTDRWNVPLTRPTVLEFRVVAQWEGGTTFEAPEVRTVTVTIANVKEEVPMPDMISLSGSSLDNATIEIQKTLENEYKYAALLELKAGELFIPVLLPTGETRYLNSTEGSGKLKDGIAEDASIEQTRVAWNIETAGEYRIVIDVENSEVTIYSPATALEPKVVAWIKNSEEPEEVHTTVTDLWLYGGGTSWGWWKGECTVSLADPQVLIYHGDALTSGDGVKFTVYGDSDYRNVAYAFTNPLTADGERQNLTLAMDNVGDLHGGYDSETRNSYYKLPVGANFIVLDLRNMTIMASKK